MFLARLLAPAALLLPLLAASVAARPAATQQLAQQDYDRPPTGFGDDDAQQGGGGGRYGYGGGSRGADAGDPGAVSVRVGKLESRIREMTGQLEELQNSNRKLVEQLQRFQADVESRLQARGGGAAKRSDASGAGAPADADSLTPPAKLAEAKPLRRGGNDAFDPAVTPGAPGAPKPLGSVASATPPDAADAPLDLSGGRRAAGSSSTLAPTLQLPSATTPRSGAASTSGGTATASLQPNSPREEFDAALGFYKDKQYETAEQGFSAFIQKNPKSRLVADATFYLGETYTQRGRSREAAEQYLKFSTDFTSSPRAAEAMLRLGSSLKAIGAKEQACASFSELPRKYPNAPAYVKTGAEREAKRAQC